jgi:uroporphyrinogen-III synthase
MTILVTRSSAENHLLEVAFVDFCDHKVLSLPIIDYQDLPLPDDINLYTDFVITSKYAVSLLSPSLVSNKNFWVVGGVTAEKIKSLGGVVRYAASSALNLNEILKEVSFGDRKFVYLSGNNITIDMPTFVARKIIYHVHYKKHLSEDELLVLKSGIDVIMLYSHKTAQIFLDLLFNYKLKKYFDNTGFVVISDKVAKILRNHFANVLACDYPEEMFKKVLYYVNKRK